MLWSSFQVLFNITGKDNLIVIDDSIVRGTTLKQSIIKNQEEIRSRSQKIISNSSLESKQTIEQKEREISAKLELKVSEAETKAN